MGHHAGAYPGFLSMKRLGVLIVLPFSLDGMLQHYFEISCVKRDVVKIKSLAQEHNALTTATALTRTARSGFQRADHKTTRPERV